MSDEQISTPESESSTKEHIGRSAASASASKLEEVPAVIQPTSGVSRSASSSTSSTASSSSHGHGSNHTANRTSNHGSGRVGKDKGSSVPRARRMKLSVNNVDPWSVTKVSFLLGIALGIIQVVAAALIWALLNSIGLFDNITQIVSNTGLDSGNMDIGNLLSIGTVLSVTTIFSIIEIIILTVLSTIGAFLYNIVSALVGGIHVTLGDD